MAAPNGSTIGDGGEAPGAAIDALAAELGLTKRTREEWRARGIVPRPRRAGNDGRKPLWLYPPHTPGQLRAAARWRRQSRDLDAIKVAVWSEGYPLPLDEIRASLTLVVDRFEQAMLKDLARYADGLDTDELLQNPKKLREALERYGDALARRRARSPMKRRVRMTLAERQRGIIYMLAPFLGVEQPHEDAIYAERAFGLSRGRSGTAQGLLPEPAAAYVAMNPITPAAMRKAIATADTDTYALVQALLHTFQTLLPALLPILLPANSALQPFGTEALALFEEAPASAVALMAAGFVTHVERQRATRDLTPEMIDSIRPQAVAREIFGALNSTQREQFVQGLRNRQK
jgi:hypothetical protein